MIFYPLVGGVLIGLSSSVLLGGIGKITGVSGIYSSILSEKVSSRNNWKHLFILGLLFGGYFMKYLFPDFFRYSLSSDFYLVSISGFIVGVGTRLGSGCTSGHGVCGLPRLAKRSIVATLVFMLFGMLTVLVKGLV